MSWADHHSQSEVFASQAEAAGRVGDRDSSEQLYREAARFEELAAAAVPPEKQRTLGITVVSAVALAYKGRDFTASERIAYSFLAGGALPSFAASQLKNLLQMVWTARAADEAGIRFVPGDVLVAVKGGLVVHGGAPLDLIVRKVESIQAFLFRTVEMVLQRPLRKQGGPPSEIQSLFRPWLFQAPAGSYQFAVRVQVPPQMDLFESDRPKVEQITSTFINVLRAAATAPESELPDLVPDKGYREAFLGIARNMAPTGTAFERLEVKDAATPALPPVAFSTTSRQDINAALRKERPRKDAPTDEVVTIHGVLRAVNLNEDWIEVTEGPPASADVRIYEAGEVLDDVIGPMVNRRVTVTAVRTKNRLNYRDIEPDE